MSVLYEEVPKGFDFNSEFDTYIIALCPDTDSWFVTNKRFFYYEYPMEFISEEAGIAYFKNNPVIFLELEKNMDVYRPAFYQDGVYLENIKELVRVKE